MGGGEGVFSRIALAVEFQRKKNVFISFNFIVEMCNFKILLTLFKIKIEKNEGEDNVSNYKFDHPNIKNNRVNELT